MNRFSMTLGEKLYRDPVPEHTQPMIVCHNLQWVAKDIDSKTFRSGLALAGYELDEPSYEAQDGSAGKHPATVEHI
jgi:hypothetical protein